MLQKSLSKYVCKLMCLMLLVTLNSFAQYPDAVEQNLKKAGKNRKELEKAIVYCQKTKDPLKLKAIYFLIANMDIHYSADYYWENKDKQKIPYNELDYPDFDQAAKAFENIKLQNPGLHPQKVFYQDLETIKGVFLIENIDKAFEAWKNAPHKNSSFETFCEYILPYRISTEPMQDWRETYATKFNWVPEKIKTIGFENTLPYIKEEANLWFTNTWSSGGRKEPLPRLGSMQILLRKQGLCEDLADLGVFTLRALGFPATVNAIPYWATATGGHSNNTFFDENQKPISFDYGNKEYNEKLIREPAKVLRITYSKQPNTIASIESANNIPKGFLREKNYIDVTQEFWETTTVKCALSPNSSNPKTVFIATFNGLQWKPFWWGSITNNQTEFTQICKGTVILPQYYTNEKMISAAPPILVGENENRILEPDYNQLLNITITSKANYLLIKPRVKYKLFYWDKAWKLIDTKIADENTQEFIYEKVPKNALLLLLSSDSKGYERPFVIDEKGERNWY